MPEFPVVAGFQPPTSWPGATFSGDPSRPKMTPQQIKAAREKFIEMVLQMVVLALKNTLLPGPAFDQIKDFADNIGSKAVEQIHDVSGLDFGSVDGFIDSLNDGAGIDLPELATVLGKVKDALDGIPWESGDPGAILRAIVQAGGQIIRTMLRSWVPLVDLGSIGRFAPNLVLENDFSAAATIESGLKFTWDSSDGVGSPLGCARIELDGTSNVLVGKTPIPVVKGQKLDVSVRVKRESVSASGPAVFLELLTFEGQTQKSVELLASLNPSGSAPFTVLTGERWTTPDGVDSVIPRLRTSEAGTAGVVKFDKVTVQKVQLLDMDFTENLRKRWENSAALMGVVDTDLDGDVDFTDVWNTLWSGGLKPLGWIPNVSQNTIDRIINAFDNLGALVDTNLGVEGVLDALFGIFNTGLTANNRVSAFEARLRSIESAANTILDGFDGAAAGNLGANWTVVQTSGGGGGSVGRDGKGNAVWRPSGAGNRTQILRYSGSALTVDCGFLQVQLSSTPQSYIFDDAYTYFCWRMNAAGDTYQRLRLGYDEIRLQKVVSGTVSNIGPAWSGSPKGGNVIDIAFGDPGGVNLGHLVVRRNEVTVLDVTDGSPVTGSLYRSVGVGMETGNRLVITQNIPAGLGVFMAAEVL